MLATRKLSPFLSQTVVSALTRRSIVCAPQKVGPVVCLADQEEAWSTLAAAAATSDTTDKGGDSSNNDNKNNDSSPAASRTTDDEITTSNNTLSLSAAWTPSQVVSELDRHIVGQPEAKRAVAIALRNRWRRQQLRHSSEFGDLTREITPRNVLLVGPTGCGKTEIARRLALLHDAPWIKVEATKFTEVGYHGRDVDQIVRDLVDAGLQLTKKLWTDKLRAQAEKNVEATILNLLAGPAGSSSSTGEGTAEGSSAGRAAHASFRDMLRQGVLDDQEIEVEVPLEPKHNNSDVLGGDSTSANLSPNIVAMTDLWQRVQSGQQGGGSKKPPTERKKLPISQAREILLDSELDKLLEGVDLKKEAISAVEQSGIVFIDEIDKICSPRDAYRSSSSDASAEGVQRDLLPLIEGTTINTKYGNVQTDYILFIASGAFHSCKPSDLLPELQGRLPVNVSLQGLSEHELYRILTEPVANLVRQHVALLSTEHVQLDVQDEALREVARIAHHQNRVVENLGARRLHSVLELLMEELSFQAAEQAGTPEKPTVLTVDKGLVQDRLGKLMETADLSKYIL